MSARDLISTLKGAGLRVRQEGEALRVSPGHLLTPELREQIAASKADLMELLSGSGDPWPELEAAINDACNARGDSDANRCGILAEAAALSARHQRDMAQHFRREAGFWRLFGEAR